MRVLRNCLLSDGRTVDVGVDAGSGTISSVQSAGSAEPPEGAEIDDLQGWLLLGAMAEPHAHLDKALTADEVVNPSGDLLGAIDAWHHATAQGRLTFENTVVRARRALELLLVHGATAVRSHVDVTSVTAARGAAAVREAADSLAGLIDVQIVALSATPMVGEGSDANQQAVSEALEAGVDLIGGCPHLHADPAAHIAATLELAARTGLAIDLHIDETLDPSTLALRELARQVRASGFDGAVTASHCVSLGMQPPEVQAAVAAEVAEAGISVVALPQTNLFLQGRDQPTATPRGLTALDALLDADVTVAAGADNVQDPFNLVGRSDPLETAALLVMAGHRLPEAAYAMVSESARAVMGLPPVNIEPGDPADLLAIDAPSLRGAIADAPMSRRVYRRGQLVAATDQQTRILAAPANK